MEIRIPESAWYDALDPHASTMQAELGLPHPTWRRVGRGHQVIYENVEAETARELAHYLWDRAENLLGQDTDPAERRPLYAARKAATRILDELGTKRADSMTVAEAAARHRQLVADTDRARQDLHLLVRSKAADGASKTALADQAGVSRQTIHNILNDG